MALSRGELEHLIRSCAVLTGDDQIVVIGSAAILAAFPEAEEMIESVEADVYPRNKPEEADMIDARIGELSDFHDMFGYYAHAVAVETVTAPTGWQERLVPVLGERLEGASGWCLEPHDLAASKIAAGREKDWRFVTDLLREGLVRPEIVRERVERLPVDEGRRNELITLLDGKIARLRLAQ